MNLLILFIFLNTADSLPPAENLYQSLDLYYKQQTQIQLTEHQSSSKNDWLRYLPTLGLTYTINGKPRPAMSWSSTLLYTSQKEKEKRIQKQKSIIQKNQLELEKEKLKLSRLLPQYKALQTDIQFLQSLFEIDKQLYEVKKDQAHHLEITPTELLKATQAFRKKEYEIFQKQQSLIKLESEILILAKYTSL